MTPINSVPSMAIDQIVRLSESKYHAVVGASAEKKDSSPGERTVTSVIEAEENGEEPMFLYDKDGNMIYPPKRQTGRHINARA